MSRSRTALPLAVLGAGALALPPAASAAGTWSTPQAARQAAGASALSPGLAFAREDGILTFSTTTDRTRPTPKHGYVARVTPSQLGFARPFGRFGPPTGTEAADAPQAYGKTRTLVLTRRRTGGKGGFTGRYAIGVSYGRTGNTLTPRTNRTIARDVPLADPPVLAANAKGDAVAAWVAYPGSDRSRLYVSQRRAGGRFGRPTVIVGSGFVDSASLAVAVSRGGDIVVAFARRLPGKPPTKRRVQARVRRHGHSIGSIEDLGVNRGVAQIDAAMGAAGRTTVAWQTFDTGEEVNEPTRVYGAVRPAGPRHFRRTATLDPGGSIGGVDATIAVAAAQDGRATVAWTQRRGPRSAPRFPVRFADVGLDAHFGASRDLAGAEGAVRDVAVARYGTTTIAWSAAVPQEGSDGPLMAATRPAPPVTGPNKAPFAPAELVSAAGDRTEGAALAFGPTGKEPTAAWLSRGAGRRLSVRVSRRG